MHSLYRERRIRSLHELTRLIGALDEDEGIRAEGKLRDLKGGGFVFIGFYRGRYCVDMCDRVWNPKVRAYITGSRDRWFDFDRADGLIEFLKPILRKPLRAWFY